MVDRFSITSTGARRRDAQAGSGLLIIDDWFPNLLSGFRVAEFVHHLRVFPGLQVICTCPDLSHFARFAERYPDVSDRESLPRTPAASMLRVPLGSSF